MTTNNKIKELINRIFLGDAIEILKEIPNGSIDTIFTDPPFMISKEIMIHRQSNPKKYKRGISKEPKFRGTDISLYFEKWDDFKTLDEYLNFMYQWLNEAKRVLRKGGHLLFFTDKFKITYWWNWCQENNFITRQPLFFFKTNPVPVVRKVSFVNSVEMIFWATKETISRKYCVFNYELGQHKDVFISPICHGKERYEFGSHPTQKPVKIIKEILQYLTKEGEIVLDPFAGSGTTGVACYELKRNFILIEKEPNYYEIAKKRLSFVQQQQLLDF